MAKRGIFLLLLITAAFAASPAVAAAPSVANGGGRGTVDGTTPFSQFGFSVTVHEDGTVLGQFNCLMAGASTFPGFAPLMKVSGDVSEATIDSVAGTAEFLGSGTLNLGPSGSFPATFKVEVTEGGPGVGTLHLTVVSPPVGSASLPLETVLEGRISIR